MDNAIYGIYGKSGFGREVIPLLRTQLPQKQIIFVDDGSEIKHANGYEVWTFDKFKADPTALKFISIAVADSEIRQKLSEKCAANAIQFHSIKAASHISMDNVSIGKGAIFCGFTMVTSNVIIGKHFHCNIYSYVAHDCVIGDYVTFAPGVKCNGNVHIDDHAYIGTGAIIKQGSADKPLRIGKGAIVGMGAVVTKDVADGVTVVGNPARVYG